MELEKVIEIFGLPKAMVEGAQSFLNRLLGPSVDEAGLLLADKIKYRRFRNQVKAIAAAEAVLKEAGLAPEPVSLQTAVPLLEKASLEEDPTMQQMWGNLLARAATSSVRAAVQRLAVEVLGSISPREAAMLREVYEGYLAKRRERLADPAKATRGDPPAEFAMFRPEVLSRSARVEARDGELLIDNLLRLGLLRFEVPEIEEGENVYPTFVHLTELGLGVLRECMEPPSRPTKE